jgi:hypothetical protein
LQANALAQGQSSATALTVVVNGWTNELLPNARVRLLSLDRVIEAHANNYGEVRLSEIPAGTYNLQVSANDFVDQTFPAVQFPSAVDTDSCKSLGGARIRLVNVEMRKQEVFDFADRHGDFVFSKLAAGRYRIEASADGYYPAGMKDVLVPRENVTVLSLGLDQHLHVCQ